MIYKAQGALLKRVSHSISTMEPLQTATFLQRVLSSLPKAVVVVVYVNIYVYRPHPSCLYYRACALTVMVIEYTCLHEQQWRVC